MPQIESYDGVKDPLNHLETFKTLMHLQGIPDEIMCKAFPATLKGVARILFSRLTPNSINTFKELNAQFTSHFIGGAQVQEIYSMLNEHQAARGRDVEVVHKSIQQRSAFD